MKPRQTEPEADTFIERLLNRFVTHVPVWVVIGACIVFYPGIGLALPLAFHWTLPNLVSANVSGVMIAALIGMTWLVAQVEAGKRRRLVDWTTNLRLLDAEEFEWMVGELFRREGWNVRERGRQDRADGNIDLELTRGREKRYVQCKRWESWKVGVNEIRKLAGTLMRESARGEDGIFVTLSSFNEQAEREARQIGLTLIDGSQLFQRIEKVRRSEACPVCSEPMLLDRSAHGWWFRCVNGSCAGKRDLGSEPAQAIEALTHTPVAAPARQG
jgi:hypothetical protein